MKKSAIFVLALSALFALTGCESTSQVSSAPDNGKATGSAAAAHKAKVGDTITLHGTDAKLKIAVTVLKVVKKASGASDFEQPAKGHHFVAVQVSLKNVGSATYDDSPSNGAALVDTQDQQYDADLDGVANGPSIGASVKLAPGSGRKGYLVFSVPNRAVAATFQFALDSGFSDQTGEWLLR